ncbi:MAG TPA: hypothetical protein VFR48_09980, partial [Solirubrobacteraceae bacterium]|nr:hypothetical protein [Solirubrobacteraceae bacterium]
MIGADGQRTDGAVHNFRALDEATVDRRGPAAAVGPLLDVSDLRVSFAIGSGSRPPVRAVDGVSFQLRRGE